LFIIRAWSEVDNRKQIENNDINITLEAQNAKTHKQKGTA
jgi:hypothetical protein